VKILLINQDWFAKELREAGHEVVSYGLAPQLDFRQEVAFVQIERVFKLLPFRPEIVIIHDNSAPLTITGLESCPVPTVFYSVDTQHHAYLHKYFSLMFDHTFVAEKDYLPEFHEIGRHPDWLPLWASRYVEASSNKKHGAVFVGTLDADLNPDRVRFFEELKKRVPIVCLTGAYWEIFPFSEIVINQTVKGDLNFRVFEAMMCGAMLLTEKAGNGLLELFKDGEHLVTYEKGNVDEAARKISYYLEHVDECRAIARRGREEVLAKHQSRNRAARFLEIIPKLQKTECRERNFAAVLNFSCLGSSWEKRDRKVASGAYVHVLRAAEEALRAGENLRVEVACYVIRAALHYDSILKTMVGADLLNRLSEAYPQAHVLRLARIRNLLNAGKREEAEALARTVMEGSPDRVFAEADRIVTSLIS
jgi:hypothetical protein